MNAQIFLQNDTNQPVRFNKIGLNIPNTDYFIKERVGKINDYGIRLFINYELCNGCKLCLYECRQKVLNIRKTANRKGFYPVEYAGTGCNGCGICVNVCSIIGAIKIFRRVKPK
jgi:Pyruvate/2-oxoacid:ferredoxin oxidoreductase delta subunit